MQAATAKWRGVGFRFNELNVARVRLGEFEAKSLLRLIYSHRRTFSRARHSSCDYRGSLFELKRKRVDDVHPATPFLYKAHKLCDAHACIHVEMLILFIFYLALTLSASCSSRAFNAQRNALQS